MYKVPRWLAVAAALSISFDASHAADRLAGITVDAGSKARWDCPVGVDLPSRIRSAQPMNLVEIRGDGVAPVPCQVEPGEPARLWFVLSGQTPARSARVSELRSGKGDRRPVIAMELKSDTLELSVAGSPFFTYNHGHVVPPEGVRPEYIRSGYIHPMFSPSGLLITEDFPDDHHHHKGVWFPWTKTEFDGHAVDFWNLGGKKEKRGTVQFAGFESFENGPVYARFKVKHEFVDLTQGEDGKIALNEVWDVRVWTAGGPEAGYWIWDITSQQRCASDSPLVLKAYRYGGLAYRGPKEWKAAYYRVLTSEGKTKKDGHATRAKWCAHSGASAGKWTTVLTMCHPKNERFPEPMRIWPQNGAFFNWVPPQKKDLTIAPGETHTFRYRFYIHQGEIDGERSESAWQDFAEPPVATLTTAP